MALNITHLRAFYRVALDGGFSRAAQNLNISQPTLSAQVAALEDRHGVHLFDRHGRTISLTHNGKELFEICQTVFGAISDADDLLSGFEELLTGEWRISSDSPIHGVQLIAAFKAQWPGPHIELTTANNAQVRADLEQSRADMVIMSGKPPVKGYGSMRLARSPLMAMVPLDHPWAKRGEIELAELVREHMLMREEGSMTRFHLEDAVQREGLELSATTRIGSREAVREGVAQSLGVGVICDYEFGGDTRIAALKIKNPRIIMDEFLVWPKDRAKTRMGQAMLQAAKEITSRPGGI